MHVDRIALDFLAPGVEPLGELLPRQHAARGEHERVQQRELARRELDAPSLELHAPRGRVELELADAQQRGRLARRAADERAQASGELVQVERLEDVVVRAAVQALDAVLHRVARGEHEHRCPVAGGAHAAQHLQAFEARQAEVEHHRGMRIHFQREVGGDAVAHPVGREARLREPRLEAVTEERIVLDHQDAHRQP